MMTYASHQMLLEVELARAGPARFNGSEDLLHGERSASPLVFPFHRRGHCARVSSRSSFPPASTSAYIRTLIPSATTYGSEVSYCPLDVLCPSSDGMGGYLRTAVVSRQDNNIMFRHVVCVFVK